jgi:hypothetical protein
MPYECAITNEKDYLRVVVSGEWNPGHELEDAIAMWMQVGKACIDEEQRRVLAIFDVPGRLPPVSAYELASNPERFGLGNNFRLAVIYLYEDRRNDSQFAETVAANRGYKVKIFDDEESALQWLI